jgi:hypothetical protein
MKPWIPSQDDKEEPTHELPEPRPLQHGYEAICWYDSALYKAYHLPGGDRYESQDNSKNR